MLRRVILLALLCVSLWTAADRAAACPPEGSAVATGAAMSLPDAPGGTSTPDHSWDAPRRNTVSNTPSVWNWQLVHSTLARVSCRDGLVAIARTRETPRLVHATRHLHNIPLLI